MKIIEGDFAGRSGRIVKSALSGPIIQVSTGLASSVSFKIPGDVVVIKLLSKEEGRTLGQIVVILLVAATLYLIPVAIALFVLWKRVSFTVGVRTRDGKRFIAQGDATDWKTVQGFVGIGAIDSF